MVTLGALSEDEVVEPELALSGMLSFDADLPLMDVTANLYEGESLIAEFALLELDSWQFVEGAFTAIIDLPSDLPTGSYQMVVEASDGLRSVASGAQQFVYRIPAPPGVTITSPVQGDIYYSTISVEGLFTVDPALTPELRAVLQVVDDESVLDLPLRVEGQSFSAVIAEPGSYRLTVSLNDGRSGAEDSVEFEYIAPEIDVLVDHSHPTDDSGIAETVGTFRFTATLDTNVDEEPQRFVLEQQVEDIWLPLQEFAAADVWSPQSQLASMVFDFGADGMALGVYQLRLNAELQNGLNGQSDPFLVRYRAADSPTLIIESPTASSIYYRDVTVSGSATWDRSATAELSAVLLRGESQLGIPLTVSEGDFRGAISADLLSTGENTLVVTVEDSLSERVQQSVTFTYQLPELAANFVEPVASGEFEILRPSLEVTGRVTSTPAFPLQNVNLHLQSMGSEIAPVDIPVLLEGDPQVDSWNPETGEFSLMLELAQYDLGPGNYELIIRAENNFPQQVESGAIQLRYREPDALDLTLNSPLATTYFEPVRVAGTVYWDPALTLNLSATLVNVTEETLPQELPLSLEGQVFTAVISEPGQYRLIVSASDSVHEIERSVSFVIFDPVVEVNVTHTHALDEEGALDVIGLLTLDAEVSNEFGVPLLGFGLEYLSQGEWVNLASYTLEEVWNADASSARLTYDFSEGDLSIGGYQLRVRVDYQGGQIYGGPLEVNYRLSVPPVVELRSPVSDELYLSSISISGSASWDPIFDTPVLAAHWRLLGGGGEEVSGVVPLGVEGGGFSGLFTPPVAGQYGLFVRLSENAGANWDTDETVFDYRLPSELAVQLTSPTFDSAPNTHVLPQIAVTGRVDFDPALPLELLQLEVELDGEPSGEAYDLLTGETWDAATNTFNISLPLQQIGAGSYVLRIVAADALARTASAEVAFTYREPEPPVITVDEVPTMVVGDLTISGSVRWDPLLGDEGVQQVWADLYFVGETPQLRMEGIPLNVDSAAFAATIASALMPTDGNYQIVVRAADIAGTDAENVTLRFFHRQSDQGLYMPMDELVGDVLPDLDGVDNSGTLSGINEAFGVGMVNRAVVFNEGAYIAAENHPEINLGTGDFSIFVWLKTDSSGFQTILDKRAVQGESGYLIYLNAGVLSFQLAAPSGDGAAGFTNVESSAPTVNDGLWHHIGITVDRDETDGGRFYVDGQLAGTFDPTNRPGDMDNDAALLIGRHQFGSNGYSGLLDDLVIAKQAFGEADIAELLSRSPVQVPQRLALTVESPVSGETYRSRLNVTGHYVIDPALVPVALNVEAVQPTGLAVTLPVEIDPQAAEGQFQLVAHCQNFTVGSTNMLRVSLLDRLNQIHNAPEISFLFTVAQPQVTLELQNGSDETVYIYGSAQFDEICPLENHSLFVRVWINDQEVEVETIGGQLPGDFIFGIQTALLQEGENNVRVEVADPRDQQAIGTADININNEPFAEPTLSLIANPNGDETRLGGSYTAGYTFDGRIESAVLEAQILHEDGSSTPLTVPELPVSPDGEVVSAGRVVIEIADALLKAGRNEVVATLDDGRNPPVSASAVLNFQRPAVVIQQPQNGSSVDGRILDVFFNVDFSGPEPAMSVLTNIRVYLDAQLIAENAQAQFSPAGGGWQLPINISQLDPGQHEIGLEIGDYRRPDVTSTQIRVGFEIPDGPQPPVVTITAPDNNSAINTGVFNVLFRVDYSDPEPEELTYPTIRVFLNNQEFNNVTGFIPNTSTGEWVLAISSEFLAQGRNILGVEVADYRDENVVSQIAEIVLNYIPTDISLTAENASGNSIRPLMGDVRVNFTSNVQLGEAVITVNGLNAAELSLSDDTAPYSYTTILSARYFKSGQNSVSLQGSTNGTYIGGSTIEFDYLNTASIAGNFNFGVGIGYSISGITSREEIQGVLAGFPADVDDGQLTLNALLIDGKRAEFSGQPTPNSFFNYRFSKKFLQESLGENSQKIVIATAYLGGDDVAISGDAVFAIYQYPGGKFSESDEQQNVTHISMDGHGDMVAFSSGENDFDGTGGGNQTMVSGSGANRYYFDQNSGVDIIEPNPTSVANNRIGNVLSYWNLSIQNLGFARIASTGDLLITHGTGFPNSFSWQLIREFFNYNRRPITSIAIPGNGSIPASDLIAVYDWTQWGDLSISDAGDVEDIATWKEMRFMPASCEPIAIQARRKDTTRIIWPGDINQDSGVVSFDVKSGYVCLNESSSSGRCENYEVRYLCPY